MPNIRPRIEDLRNVFISTLGIPEANVRVNYDTKYPECVYGVVLQDVNPSKMSEVAQTLDNDFGLRICINVVEEENAHPLHTLPLDDAFEESWMAAIATVRS